MLVALAGLGYSYVQTQQTNKQMRQANEQARDDRALAKEGQITDRYNAAVGNLGEDKMDVRLGGIYALERIMKDSHRDQPTIANVLATYIRTHAVKPPAKGEVVPADVRAALTVVSTRDPAHDDALVLDLRAARLGGVEPTSANRTEGAAFSHADLRGVDLSDSSLAGADLSNSSLTGADLSDSNLTGADLRKARPYEADLRDADLSNADLRGTQLDDADLRGANLSGADLREADLSGVDLRGVKNLTREQVDSARADDKTQLP